MTRRPLSEFPIVEIDGCHAVIVRDWRSNFYESTIRWMGKPLRAECSDLWIVTSTAEDAERLARLAQRDFEPEDPTAPRERYVTTKRQPTFESVLALVPQDVGCYFSASPSVDDLTLIQRLHPAPARVNEQITWSAGSYDVRSRHAGWNHGHFRATIGHSPKAFANALARAREELLSAVGPGFDATLDHLNTSPLLAHMLQQMVRPAAEAAAHWLRRLGSSEIHSMTIPALGFRTDLPIRSLTLESTGANLHASFFAMIGDLRITEMEVSGLMLPDTVGTALDEMARRGEIRLSQIVDLPGAAEIPVLCVERQGSSWTARLDPVSMPVTPPQSIIPFEGDEEIARMQQQGDEVSGDAAIVLGPLGRERSAFILCCVKDGSSGSSFDITAWTPGNVPAEIFLSDRCFQIRSSRRTAPLSLLKELP